MSISKALDYPPGVQVLAAVPPDYAEILTYEALELAAHLHRALEGRRRDLLAARQTRQAALDAGVMPDFLPETAGIRNDPEWRVASTPPDLQQRWVEITGPTDRKMLINALNSGADVFMADFEDANSPSWSNMIDGQLNLRNVINRTIEFTSPEGKQYRLNDQIAVLMVRPRGWHLVEKHVLVDGTPVSGSLFDFSLFLFHNARRLIEKGSGPYFYLPKIENHLEARLWNDAFRIAQELIGIPAGTIRATVLIETVLAAYEMDEILFELREHAAGLNAGRWDYIFSIIKKFRNQPGFVLPDRAQITMTVPFMRSYTELLVRTCHARGAHAMGGMAAFIPSRKDQQVNELALRKVREDKLRESQDGFDGTWVAHPDLVPVARQIFEAALQGRPNQKGKLRRDVSVTGQQLHEFVVPGGEITEAGLRLNINVGIQYIESWLRGIGAAAIYNLMEDAATAEISRAQVWQWVHNPNVSLSDGRPLTASLVHAWIPKELEKIRQLWGAELFAAGKFHLAAEIFEQVATAPDFIPFLTLLAYQYID